MLLWWISSLDLWECIRSVGLLELFRVMLIGRYWSEYGSLKLRKLFGFVGVVWGSLSL